MVNFSLKTYTVQTSSDNILHFREIYISYYSRMKRFAQEYVIREEDAENIVQDVFMELWEHRQFLTPHTNLFAYLFTAVKNKCIDFLRHKTTVQKTADKLQNEYLEELQLKFQSLEAFDEQIFQEPEIETIIQNALNSLPEKCRKILVMNKLEGKKQKTIAEELNISVNTVESQMAIAYKKLKIALKDYTPLLVFILI